MKPAASRPAGWPRFSSTLRSTAVTARVGRVLGVFIGICFVTGLLSHYQYQPWSWLPVPASPVWGYRLTQGIHVTTGIAAIPLLLLKLWSVYPNLFRWPPLRSLRHLAERLSVAVLVSTTLVQLATGFLNVMNWYAWPWSFVSVHRFLGYVVVGSILLHIAVKLPDIKYGLSTRVPDGDVLTEIPWEENPKSHSNAGPQPPPVTPALSRRGLLLAGGLGVGAVAVTSVGATLTPLRPLALLAARDPGRGPQGVPVNKTAERAQVIGLADSPTWVLEVAGPRPYAMTLAELEAMDAEEDEFPISCVEGWSAMARWRGPRLLDVVRLAGGDKDSRVRLRSVQPAGPFRNSYVEGPQLGPALLATHINGQRLNLDHGYPVRLIAPNRAGVLNTKWLGRIEVR